MSKFEKLLDLLVNEQKDEAEKLFHEIVVEKSRQIYEGILAEEEETLEADESADKDDADEVEEAKDESKDSEDEVEESEEPAESTDETIEEIGGDATDDLLSDIEAEAEGMEDMDVPGEEGEEKGEEGEAEEMFEPLEKELDALKAEFAKMMDDKGEETEEESFEPEFEAAEETVEAEEVEESTEKKNADTLIKEYSQAVKAEMGDHADEKHSPVAKSSKSSNEGKPHQMGVGGEEKGSKAPAPKDMGVSAKNEPGIKSAKLETAPKAVTSEKSAK